MEENSWWTPKNLKEAEKAFRGELNLGEINTKNDFGSYKVMLETNDLEYSKISLHNDLSPEYKIRYIKKLVKIQNNFKIIYDVGCGLGFTTNALSQFYPNYEVIGVDISNDAIEFGKAISKVTKFQSEVIDPKDKSQKFKADMICAFEFYPFTRTDDLTSHIEFISHFSKDLNRNGKIIIFQKWNNPKSLSKNYEILKTKFPNLWFEDYFIPPKKIAKVFKSRLLSNLVSAILLKVLKLTTNYQMGIQKMVVITKVC